MAKKELKTKPTVVKVTAKDEFGVELLTETVDGNIELVVSTPKYDAMDSAKAALAKLIDAENIDVENYLDEKAKIEDARAKVEIAYEYLVRDSQLGEELVSNLLASEEKLTEIKPYYDAVDTLNAIEKEAVASTTGNSYLERRRQRRHRSENNCYI